MRNPYNGRRSNPLYNTWADMIQRCCNEKNPSWPTYGGNGIRVCDRWRRSFDNFYSDVGDKPSDVHTLDRRDNLGNYSPENCRWATPHEQALNKSHPILRRETGEHNIEKRGNKYRVQIKRYQKQNHIGTFETMEEAIYARDEFTNMVDKLKPQAV